MTQSSKNGISKANPHQSFPKMESEILDFWLESDILNKSINNPKNIETKTFYDGPITANGMPHHGHMLTFAIKDLFPRYWTMKGYKVNRSLGWDCQGIPVEYEIEKKLGFKEKSDIEKYGIAKFNSLCRESVQEYKTAMIDLEQKMGRLTNEEEEYATMDANYIESIWWSLKTLHKKNLLYEGFKVVPYSTRAGTSLSNAEVSLGGYKKIVEKAVTVKFELVDEKNTFILAWTTTPWTLPTNMGLAVGEGLEYVNVTESGKGESYIIAKNLIEKVFTRDGDYKIETFDISKIIGKKYIPLFNYFSNSNQQAMHTIVYGFHVSDNDGTGIVHLAPYGKEDCEIFADIGITPIDVLNSQGDYLQEFVPDLAGMYYSDANSVIIKSLEEKNLLFKTENYTHDMPMCWRTNTPLIYKPIDSWYIASSQIKENLMANNETVNWVPKNIKQGRFGHWLADIKDWGISRLRYWGTPLPIWKSESGKVKIIGSYKELQDLSGILVTDPHRPFIDDVKFSIDGEEYTRIPDVIDVWYDSGAMPFARFHYPFENKELFESKFPAEFIAEGVDQTRGWFYSLMAISTALFDSSPYKNVIVNGFTLDDKGVKVSKSKKNYTSPDKLFELFGADTIRFNYFTTPIVAGEDSSITEKTLKRTMQEITLPLWNMQVYLTTYAELFNFVPSIELYRKTIANYLSEKENDLTALDKWILFNLNETINNVTVSLNTYGIQKAMMSLKALMDDISKWYIRRSRDRFAAGNILCIEVLYMLMVNLSKLMAPFAPFISEKIYFDLVKNPLIVDGQNTVEESVHLTTYPLFDAEISTDLAKVANEMELVRNISSVGQKLRLDAGIKLRQPLQSVSIISTQKSTLEMLNHWQKLIIKEELNVLDISTQSAEGADKLTNYVESDEIENIKIVLNTDISPELERLGNLSDLNRYIQDGRKQAGLKMGQITDIEICAISLEQIEAFVNNNLHYIQTATNVNNITFKTLETEPETKNKLFNILLKINVIS